MSSVCDLGTIRSIIRGIDVLFPHTLIAEVIDDGEHSNSKKIFVDFNIHEKKIIIGFENPATEDQLDKMITWNPSSKIHHTSNISTCGQGLKYYEFRVRGQHIHVTRVPEEESGKYIYKKSEINSSNIYKAANSAEISDSEFSEILRKNTTYVNCADEVVTTIGDIFNNKDNVYPFPPKTIFIAKDISNNEILEWFKQDVNINELNKELTNKYFEEIKSGKLTVYIKYPGKEFCELGKDCNIDVIGSTNPQNLHVTELYYVQDEFEKCKKGDYIIRIKNTMFQIHKNGTSLSKNTITVKDCDMPKLLLQFTFTQYQYTINPLTCEEDKNLKRCIVGTSLEDYCGIYMKIGDKFIDGKPIAFPTLAKRNLQGAKHYRGILNLENPKKTKPMLGIHGLKSEFNLSNMKTLDPIIKQCTLIYKKYCTNHNNSPPAFETIEPDTYCTVKTSNKKSERTTKPGHNYLLVVGKDFYKFGVTYKTNREKRIFVHSNVDYEKARQDFPNEEIFKPDKWYYEYLSPLFNTCASTEQKVKEDIMERQNVVCYDQKIGDDTREYFHCDSPDTLREIKMVMISEVV
jgi:hypothetical protein